MQETWQSRNLVICTAPFSPMGLVKKLHSFVIDLWAATWLAARIQRVITSIRWREECAQCLNHSIAKSLRPYNNDFFSSYSIIWIAEPPLNLVIVSRGENGEGYRRFVQPTMEYNLVDHFASYCVASWFHSRHSFHSCLTIKCQLWLH